MAARKLILNDSTVWEYHPIREMNRGRERHP